MSTYDVPQSQTDSQLSVDDLTQVPKDLYEDLLRRAKHAENRGAHVEVVEPGMRPHLIRPKAELVAQTPSRLHRSTSTPTQILHQCPRTSSEMCPSLTRYSQGICSTGSKDKAGTGIGGLAPKLILPIRSIGGPIIVPI